MRKEVLVPWSSETLPTEFDSLLQHPALELVASFPTDKFAVFWWVRNQYFREIAPSPGANQKIDRFGWARLLLWNRYAVEQDKPSAGSERYGFGSLSKKIAFTAALYPYVPGLPRFGNVINPVRSVKSTALTELEAARKLSHGTLAAERRF